MQLCGLWKQKSKDTGLQFLSGTILGDLQLMIFPNKQKKGKAPDYYAVLVLPSSYEGRRGGDDRSPRGGNDDDVPF